MKHNLVNFTRGSQLLGHFGFMFAAGLKGPLIVALPVVLGLVCWDVSSALDDYQFYLLWMHIYACAYSFMEFDPAKLVNLRLPEEAWPPSPCRSLPTTRQCARRGLSSLPR